MGVFIYEIITETIIDSIKKNIVLASIFLFCFDVLDASIAARPIFLLTPIQSKIQTVYGSIFHIFRFQTHLQSFNNKIGCEKLFLSGFSIYFKARRPGQLCLLRNIFAYSKATNIQFSVKRLLLLSKSLTKLRISDASIILLFSVLRNLGNKYLLTNMNRFFTTLPQQLVKSFSGLFF